MLDIFTSSTVNVVPLANSIANIFSLANSIVNSTLHVGKVRKPDLCHVTYKQCFPIYMNSKNTTQQAQPFVASTSLHVAINAAAVLFSCTTAAT